MCYTIEMEQRKGTTEKGVLMLTLVIMGSFAEMLLILCWQLIT